MDRQRLDKYLEAYDLGGLILLAKLVIDDECNDSFVAKTSKIVPQPEAAMIAICTALMDIPRDVFRGLVTGRILLDNRFPPDSIFTLPSNSASFTSQVSSTTTKTSGSGTGTSDSQKDYVVSAIVNARDNNGVMEYEFEWEGYAETSWATIDGILTDDEEITCLSKFQEFYANNPNAPRYARSSLSQRLIPISEEPEQITYMHAFVHVGPLNMFEHPTTNQLLQILDGMDYYLKDFKDTDQEYDDHQLFVRRVDNPDPCFNISSNGWDKSYNKSLHLKKHVRRSKTNPDTNMQRVVDFSTIMIPNLRVTLEAIPPLERDQPYHRPWFEVGLTVNPKSRMKQHATHILTTPGLAFVECVSFAIFGQDSPRWVYQPIARPRRPEDVPWLESFMTKLLRASITEGGVNIEPAGISMTSAAKMVLKDISKAYSTIDWALSDANMKWHQDRFKLIRFVVKKPERDALEKRVEDLTQEAKEAKLSRDQARRAVFKSIITYSDHLAAAIASQEKIAHMEKLIKLLDRRKEIVDRMKQLSVE